MNRIYKSMTLSAVIFLLAGCGDSGPVRVPVQGKIIMQDGKPVFPGSIALEPIKKSAFRSSSLLYEEGRFKMRTYPHGEGVVPGKYKVVLSLGMGSPPELAKYGSVESTPLKLDVPEAGLTDLTLKLDEVTNSAEELSGPPGTQR